LNLSPEEVKQLQRLIRQTVAARFAGHPDLEDITQDATLAAWQVINRAAPMPIERAMAWGKRAALWQLSEWYRDRRNPGRQHTRRGVALPPTISLEELVEEQPVDWQGELLAAAEADRLVGNLVDARVLTPLAWELLVRTVMGTESLDEVAAECSLSLKVAGVLVGEALVCLRAEAVSQGQQKEARALFQSWQHDDKVTKVR